MFTLLLQFIGFCLFIEVALHVLAAVIEIVFSLLDEFFQPRLKRLDSLKVERKKVG